MIVEKVYWTRRQVLRQCMAGLVTLSSTYGLNQRQPGGDHGRIDQPIDMPAIPLRCADGSFQLLTELTRGKATAVQLIFTQCTTTCPIEAAIFQQVQTLLPDSVRRKTQLLSVSIDPSNDTPQSLRKWLHRFHAGSQWTAAVPQSKDVPAIQSLFGDGRNTLDNHATRIQVVNPRSQMVWSSVELPSPESVAAVLSRVLD